MSLQHVIEDAQTHHAGVPIEKLLGFKPLPDLVELVIVDEADRLRPSGLEQMRDFYDRRKVALILIGMPGIEKRLARYPKLYSRVGFVHQFRPLVAKELQVILEHKWRQLGLEFNLESDVEATAAIARTTGGNFRLIERIFAQIERILEITALSAIASDVVQAARESLVIGVGN